MGYCYTTNPRRLVCDVCSAPGATKRPCPHGYCPAPAVCPACWAKPELRAQLRQHHELECKPAAARYAARQAAKQAHLDAGRHVFCSASSTTGGRVSCSFRNHAGDVLELELTREAYEALRARDVATLELDALTGWAAGTRREEPAGDLDEHEGGQLRLGAAGDQLAIIPLPAGTIPASSGATLTAPGLEELLTV